ncbi:MAG: ATP-binding cassette domain-containing protein [Aggregatilineales bacterium]
MKEQVALQVDHVSKSYGDFRAVDNVSFEVNRGEIFAMLGPNGAGKSTTIRMILDIMKPDTGTIRVFGAPINDASKDRIGYLPEERGLYKGVKVIDVMTYLGTLKGMSHRNAHDRAMEMLERLDLQDNANSKVSELSKGMGQKVQFAVTVLHEPDLVIIDEPFSGLDPVNTMTIKQLILDMREKGTAIIMSTHQMQQVEEMADRLLMINRGKQALYGSVNDVRRQYALHAVIVDGEGNWEGLPGVVQVENAPNERDSKLLHLAENVSTNDLLASIAATPGTNITRFEEAVPSLNDIFIRVVGERVLSTGDVERVEMERV